MDGTLQLGTISHTTTRLVMTVRFSYLYRGLPVVFEFKSKTKSFTPYVYWNVRHLDS